MKRLLTLFASFYLFTLNVQTQELKVFTVNDPAPQNLWTTWEAIARPWLMTEFHQPWERCEVKISNAASGGSYDMTFNFMRDQPLHQWVEDLPTSRFEWFVRFEYFDGMRWRWSEVFRGPDFFVDRTGPGYMYISANGYTLTTFPTSIYWHTVNTPAFIWDTPSDAGSGVSHYQVSHNGGTYSNVTSGWKPTLSTGQHRFSFRAIDNVGNIGATRNVYLNIDITPPAIYPAPLAGTASASPNPAWHNNTQVSFSINGADGGSGVLHRYESTNEGAWNSIGFIYSEVVTTGTYTFDFKCVDKAGNESAVKRFYARVDLVLPEISITAPADGSLMASDSLDLEWTGADIHSGIRTFRLKLNDEEWSDLGSVQSHRISDLADGTHQLILEAWDHARNTNRDTISIVVDTTPPEITTSPENDTIPADENCQAVIGDYTGEISFSDLTDPDPAVMQSPAPGTVIEETDREIIITVTDEAGNTATTTFHLHLADVLPPVPQQTTLEPLQGQCALTVEEIPVALDNCNGEITGTTDDPLTFSEQGNYTIVWSFDDGNGNITTQEQSVHIADTTPPVANEITLQEVQEQCIVSELTPPTATDNCDGPVTGTTDAVFPITAQGVTVVTWTFTDAAGNSAVQEQTVVLLDTIPPVIVCPENPAVNLEPGSAAYVITGNAFDPVTLTDNCTVATLTNSINGLNTLDGVELAAGTVTITWTATDNALNETSCSFDITVSPPVTTGSILQDQTRIWPNPTTGQVKVAHAYGSLVSVSVFDMSGQILMHQTNAVSPVTMDMSPLQPGVYIMELGTGIRTEIHKLLKY